MIILAVRRRSWREFDRWSFGGGLFCVLFDIHFLLFSLAKHVQVCRISVVLPFELWQVFHSLNIILAFAFH